MNTANSKTKHSNQFIYNFTDKLNLKNPNKNIALANLSIYYTWKNVKSDYNNNIQNLKNEGIRVNNFDEINKEIRDHIQNLKDEDIDVNINNDQVNDLVDKTFKGIGKRDSAPEDSIPRESTPK